MTGMLASFACCSSGMVAWLSMRGDGDCGRLFESAVEIMSNWRVDRRLAVRALEGHSDLEVLGGLLGADLHGLPELVLEALRNQRDIRRRPEPSRPRCRRGWRHAPIRAMNVRLVSMTSSLEEFG